MALITGNQLAVHFGQYDIFANIDLAIHNQDRVAIVGPNGRGKTTLLRVLAGALKPSHGQLRQASNLKIGYLQQEVALNPFAGTLYQLAETAFHDLQQQQQKLTQLEIALADDVTLLEKYGEAQAAFELAGGYTYDLLIQKVLTGLGFQETDHQQPVQHLSGGQQARANLARLLLAKPQLLLLDEPTNHLDLAAITWLESFLLEWSGALVIVSHDRYFLDKMVDQIWELYPDFLDQYRGNYTAYRQQRLARWQQRGKALSQQQAYIASEEAYIQRNLAGRQAKQAQGRLKRLNRLKEASTIKAQPPQKKLALNLQANLRSGDLVLATQDLIIGYPNNAVSLKIPNLEIHRGDRIALIGPNGSGKTTFLQTITKTLAPRQGQVRLDAAVQLSYFAQVQNRLNDENSLLDELWQHRHNILLEDARRHLGRFLFSGDDALKKVGALSGGERSRLALAKFTLSEANFLLLDEPTNHLDLPSQEILEAVLAEYSGTLLFVSHDRYFIDALANQLWLIEENEIVPFQGTYQQYLAANDPKAVEASTTVNKSNVTKSQIDDPKLTAEIAKVDEQILAIETLINQLLLTMKQAIDAQKVTTLSNLATDYNHQKAKLVSLLRTRHNLESRLR